MPVPGLDKPSPSNRDAPIWRFPKTWMDRARGIPAPSPPAHNSHWTLPGVKLGCSTAIEHIRFCLSRSAQTGRPICHLLAQCTNEQESVISSPVRVERVCVPESLALFVQLRLAADLVLRAIAARAG